MVTAKVFEPISLHAVMQDIRVNDVAWLCVGMGRVSPQEAAKRRQLVEAFVLWLFDEVIVPLLRVSFCSNECQLITVLLLRHRDSDDSV